MGNRCLALVAAVVAAGAQTGAAGPPYGAGIMQHDARPFD
jgi:hypothetical protein